MPGVDFDQVRSAVSMAQVLELLQFAPVARHGEQVRGPCPVHGSESGSSRSFSANLADSRYRCFKCVSAGGTLELWAAVHKTSVYEAAIELCERVGIEVPWIKKW